MADVYLKGVFTQPSPSQTGPPAQRAPATGGPPTAYHAAEIAGFAGTYYSDELETTYVVSVEGGEFMWMTRGVQRTRLPMQAGGRDEFRAAGSTLRFERDAGGRVTGLAVDAGRIRGVRFVRHTP